MPTTTTLAATVGTSTIAPVAQPSTEAGWMRNRPFDVHFVWTTSLLALAAGLAGLVEPRLFAVVLAIDVWALGYHHVVSTFTRLTFDRESFGRYRNLVIQLPIAVTVITLAAVISCGYWVLPTVYLYWQWFHYTRQSYGIERIYRRKAGATVRIDDYLTVRTLYLLPLAGILYRSYQGQARFLDMEIWYLPIRWPVLAAVAGVTGVAMAAWCYQIFRAWMEKRLAVPHTLYVLSHHLIFLTGYILIEDITVGWLVLNVWHNIQYILLVWLYNNNRFRKGIDQQAPFLSTLSQTRNVLFYFGFCLAISTAVYAVLRHATHAASMGSAIPVTLIVFMIINFHHYVVDGIIWKGRTQAARNNLGQQPA